MDPVPVSQVFGFLGSKAVFQGSDAVCANATFNCADPLPPCRSLVGFDFPSLWEITKNYNETCPQGRWLVKSATNSTIALTNKAAEAIVGAGFKIYPTADICVWVELFVVVHLMGDPIGALEDLIRKFEGCQARAVFWQARFKTADIPSLSNHGLMSVSDDSTPSFSNDNVTPEKRDIRMWKAFAIIADSYDEWGSVKGGVVSEKLSQKLQELRATNTGADPAHLTAERVKFCKWCLMTAGALAADRSTKFLPVVVAQAFFIGNIAIAMIRTKSIAEQDNPSTYINIEMHSIGFTALFFWLISAVSMTSVIGASQTAEALPRILDRFAKDLKKAHFQIELPLKSEDGFPSKERVWKGGIYSWQPESHLFPAYRTYQKAREEVENHENATTDGHTRVNWLQKWPDLLPYTIFATAILTGMGVSFTVPPIGWSCRSEGEIIIACIWILSYCVSVLSRYVFNRAALYPFHFEKGDWATKLFWFSFGKDLLVFLATMAMVMATQFGIYNKSSCYTKWGKVGLALPQQDETNQTLQAGLRFGGSYTVIVTFGVLVQLVIIPLLLLWRYHAAFRVFLQRDDGTSNLDFPRLGWFLRCSWSLVKVLGRVLAFCWRLIKLAFRRGGGAAPADEPLLPRHPDEVGREMDAIAANDGHGL